MNIVLTGFMATGKTSVGKALARRLGMKFVDTDALIEKRAGMKIRDIFSKYGEKKFRLLESKVISETARKKGVVISTGGGAVLKERNMELLARNGIIVNLKSGREIILKRVSKSKDRPLLDPEKIKNLRNEIRKILAYRKPFYEKCSFSVRTGDTNPEHAAARIIGKLPGCFKRND